MFGVVRIGQFIICIANLYTCNGTAGNAQGRQQQPLGEEGTSNNGPTSITCMDQPVMYKTGIMGPLGRKV